MTNDLTRSRRSYDGPAFFSGGFRPMFLLGAIWAVVAMVLWLVVLISGWSLPGRFDPVDWHAHELLFGFAPAVVCGFLLTAIPNWTGRLPVTGAPLGTLAGLWVLGRVAVLSGASFPAPLVMLADLLFLIVLAGFVTREIIAGKNWRNVAVLMMLTLILIGNALFHLSAMAGELAAHGVGFRLGVGALIGLIGLIGGRVIPSFTRNFLAQRNESNLPVPFNRFDKTVMLISVVTLAAWVIRPAVPITALLLLLAGMLHIARMARWSGWQARRQVLVLILHLAYAFLPLGYLIVGGAILWPGAIPAAAGVHAWMVGGVATMMLAVMTRASLGHTGRPLTAGGVEKLIFSTIILGAIARIWAVFPGTPDWVLYFSAIGWIVAFGGFVLFYGPILLTPRIAAKKPGSARPAA